MIMSQSRLKNNHYLQMLNTDGDAVVAEGACIISGCYGSFVDGGYMCFSNLGGMIGFALECYISRDLDKVESKLVKTPSDEQDQAELTVAELALDDLLGAFMKQGYQMGMKKRLEEIINAAPTSLKIDHIWVLPGDLDDLVESVHPLANYDAYESEEEAEAKAPAFDLNNPEHCTALKDRLWDLSC